MWSDSSLVCVEISTFNLSHNFRNLGNTHTCTYVDMEIVFAITNNNRPRKITVPLHGQGMLPTKKKVYEITKFRILRPAGAGVKCGGVRARISSSVRHYPRKALQLRTCNGGRDVTSGYGTTRSQPVSWITLPTYGMQKWNITSCRKKGKKLRSRNS